MVHSAGASDPPAQQLYVCALTIVTCPVILAAVCPLLGSPHSPIHSGLKSPGLQHVLMAIVPISNCSQAVSIRSGLVVIFGSVVQVWLMECCCELK